MNIICPHCHKELTTVYLWAKDTMRHELAVDTDRPQWMDDDVAETECLHLECSECHRTFTFEQVNFDPQTIEW